MPGIGRWQTRFLLLLFPLWLSIRGRHNFANLARYGQYGEGAIRNNFARKFDWWTFNRLLCQTTLGPDLILGFDPSYLSKSGKFTEGKADYWSGCAGQVLPGLEISGIAAVDLQTNSALHVGAFQTLPRAEGQTLLEYYAEGIIAQRQNLRQLSTYVVADAYFSKAPFVDKLLPSGFEVVSRLRVDAAMRYLYQGESKGKGRPCKYDGRVDARQLRRDVFTECGRDDEKHWVAYTAKVNVMSWKRTARVVIIHQLDKDGNLLSHRILVSTDIDLLGERILRMYPARYQQEFLFRDAKQELGLNHCQAYTADKIDYHVNTALTVGSLAKAAHHLSCPAAAAQPFSIADVKTEYVNENQALHVLSMFNIDVNSSLIAKLMPKIRKCGKRAA